ncbi:glycoside hydrolase family 30 protein [Metabacillus iocasae]|uniref:Glucosylceramidase n=1 Tax=Priestia iocasae TaxID=2291674 RepID=A0ABS2QYJ4_9BACI|nr:glucosylceramidase [Metabacillus iocasae]
MKTKEIQVIQTARDTGDRLSAKEPLSFQSNPSLGETVVTLDENQTFQTMLGFGGAFTESSAYVLSQVNPELRDQVINRYFDPVEGLGYRFGRTHINSCDFSLGNYTYVDEHDESLASFSIERETKLVIPLIKDAMKVAGEPLFIVSSPWSPPPWMKDTNEMNNGGKLLPEYRLAWAEYYAKYIEAMEEKGIDIWGVTIQNEPEAKQVWDSCLYTAEDERDFIKYYLGPALLKSGYEDKKVIIWDHNRDNIYERAKVILSDEDAAKYVWGTGVHWYVSEEFENLSKVHHAFPDKHLIFTEGCMEGGVHLGAWQTGERYGRNIIGDLNNYLEAWIDWNLVLDEKGGPNHVGNYCDAPVIVDVGQEQVHYNSSYYYIGHFSKYIKPGAQRILCNVSSDNVLATAFKNQDGTIVVVLMNEQDDAQTITLSMSERSTTTTIPAHSISTFIL